MTYHIPLIACLVLGSAAQSAPYCADLLNREALPKKYARVAPIYSDQTSGWIFTQDQLKNRYEMKASSLKLVQAIVDEFAARNVPLAIVVAPPRPVIAGQDSLDAAMGQHLYSVADARSSFDKMITQLASTGAIVPNLLDVALADPDVRDSYYFRRDTHWTAVGSAVSATALANTVNTQVPDLFANDGDQDFRELEASGAIQEEGSLAEVVHKACGTALPPETSETFDLSRSGDLLEDPSDDPAIALLGSSFSNRYKRDHYRVADALALAFDADVENFSVSGGGPIGAIEAYVMSGALDRKDHDLVVWELPYTESFNSQSFLRQLLGALSESRTAIKAAYLQKKPQATLVKFAEGVATSGIEIEAEDIAKQSFTLEVRFDNGSTAKVYLGRRNSVPLDMRSSSLRSSLSHFGNRAPVEIVISPIKGARIKHVAVF
ncbi:MAG: alginate O-acetyltransferase AlgX-related protein [Shimia sp.]|uniref:alginate O-acetyltransferase AlgX-related protein n=1 Tax=Shimia sp. TaxID=1954381 RepID=UPI004057D036